MWPSRIIKQSSIKILGFFCILSDLEISKISSVDFYSGMGYSRISLSWVDFCFLLLDVILGGLKALSSEAPSSNVLDHNCSYQKFSQSISC